jgi:purine nucleosidase
VRQRVSRASRIVRACGAAVAVLALLALATFAIPVPTWRTGELPVPPLDLVKGGPAARMPERIWIDTDAACGHVRTTDPDDCLAILLLARAPGVEIVGISTVFGNAPLAVTDRTTRDLMAILERGGIATAPVHRGSAGSVGEHGGVAPEPAHVALRKALAEAPLTVVSLGPLTNVAAALGERPDLQANVARLVAVMGRRPGHLFHPAEGAGDGILFGHGPVFRDFNFDQDREATTSILEMGLPTTLVPYDAARELTLTGADLARLEPRGDTAAWVASRARAWLDFWKEDVGKDGFYPFDLLAGAYVIEPRLFDCATSDAWVSKDPKLRNLFYDPQALLVGFGRTRPADGSATGRVIYCPQVSPDLHRWLMSRLGAHPNEHSAS